MPDLQVAPLLPSLTVKWGSYDQADPETEDKLVSTVVAARGKGPGGGEPLITKRIAIYKLREVFDIENVDALLDELEKEAEESAQREIDAATAQIEATARAGGAQPNAASPPGAASRAGGGTPSGKVNAGGDD